MGKRSESRSKRIINRRLKLFLEIIKKDFLREWEKVDVMRKSPVAWGNRDETMTDFAIFITRGSWFPVYKLASSYKCPELPHEVNFFMECYVDIIKSKIGDTWEKFSEYAPIPKTEYEWPGPDEAGFAPLQHWKVRQETKVSLMIEEGSEIYSIIKIDLKIQNHTVAYMLTIKDIYKIVESLQDRDD